MRSFNICPSPNVKGCEPRRVRWQGHEACAEDDRNEFVILIEYYQAKEEL
jgi:hypothetical protein